MKYTLKNPVEVEAQQLTHENMAEVMLWCGGKHWSEPPLRAVTGISVHPTYDQSRCNEYAPDQTCAFGDWVVQYLSNGDFECVADSEFHRVFQLKAGQEP